MCEAGTPPAVSIANVFSNRYLYSGFAIGAASSASGTVASVEVSIDGAAFVAAAGTSAWSFALPRFKLETLHSIVVRATDSHACVSTTTSVSFRAGTNHDVNGDGYPDLLVGAPPFGSSPGTVYLYESNGAVTVPTGSSVTPTATLTGPDTAFGVSLALGDVNGDGYAEVIVGDAYTGGGSTGVYVFDAKSFVGRTAVPYGLASAQLTGANPSAGFGESIAAGDVDGDGYADVIVADPFVGATFGTGAVYVFRSSGATGVASATYAKATTTLTGTANSDFGTDVAIGDANGDGFGDLLVAAPGSFRTAGAAYVFASRGATGIASGDTTTAATTQSGTAGVFAQGVLLADLNGDGYDDAIVSSLSATGSGVSVFTSRGTTGVPSDGQGSASATLESGLKLAAGDVNGDGYLDLVVGVPGGSNTAYVYTSTGPNGLGTTAAATLTGPVGAEFGQAVSAMDVNGDGYADATVSACNFNSNAGAFYVFRSSGTAGVGSSSDSSASTTVTGAVAAGDLGFALTR